tara:strand:+ start:403 stop:870 length:468 start_codon:yes stop_codon:yes gene_type:complete
MFSTIRIEGVNTEFFTTMIGREFPGLWQSPSSHIPCDAWYKSDVMDNYVSSPEKSRFASHPYASNSLFTNGVTREEFVDMQIVLSEATITFQLLDDGEQYPGGAVGAFTITFNKADDIALNMLQTLEYHDMLNQISVLETELMCYPEGITLPTKV